MLLRFGTLVLRSSNVKKNSQIVLTDNVFVE
jgi:hypothetical protein